MKDRSNSCDPVAALLSEWNLPRRNFENATFRAANYASVYVDNFATKHSREGLRGSFTTPICGTVNRDHYLEPALLVRLTECSEAPFSPCFKDSHAMRKCTFEGGLHVVSTLLRARRFHLRRHSAALGSNLKSAEDVVPRCRRRRPPSPPPRERCFFRSLD